jgi:hypothetical protein
MVTLNATADWWNLLLVIVCGDSAFQIRSITTIMSCTVADTQVCDLFNFFVVYFLIVPQNLKLKASLMILDDLSDLIRNHCMHSSTQWNRRNERQTRQPTQSVVWGEERKILHTVGTGEKKRHEKATPRYGTSLSIGEGMRLVELGEWYLGEVGGGVRL